MKNVLSFLFILIFPLAALAEETKESFDYELKGFWKTRGAHIKNVFLGQANYTDVGLNSADEVGGRLNGLKTTGYLEHTLRLSPSIGWQEIAVLKMDFDVLDNVIWGDNNAVAALPLFAGAPSNTDRFGNEHASFKNRRAWLELKVPVGLLKVGRMPSHWGMGLLANSGDGLGDDLGDYYRGSTVDRILFATRPLQIIKTIMGSADPKSNLVMALAYDKLADDAIDDIDPDSERACTSCSPQILLAKPNDDVDEWVGVLVYKDEKANVLAPSDLIQVGTYVVHRIQKNTQSKVWVVDGHAKLRLGDFGFESEAVWIKGTSAAITGDNPKDIDILGGVGRLGYYQKAYDIEFESGYAPGDKDPTDLSFSGYPFHADFNVGLILYNEVLAARTARVWGQELRGLWSNGGVYNSFYLNPKMRWRPSDKMTLFLGFLWARADEDNGAIWGENLPPSNASDLDLGYEVDAAVRYDFAGKAHFKLAAGVLVPGRGLWKDVAPEVKDLQITDADKADNAYTIQARLGFEF